MNRLDFRLPEFTRYAWASDEARNVWAPRITRIQAAWSEIEWRSVAAGVRPCAHRIVDPAALDALAERVAEVGLSVARFGEVGMTSGAYSSAATPVVPGQPFAVRVVIGKPETNVAFCDAWNANDQIRIGEALGYPACCQRFFQRVWVDERCMDTTWSMAQPKEGDRPGSEIRTRSVKGPKEANMLLRWLGIRAVPHLPCSFDCTGTVELAHRLLAVGREAGFVEEMDWLLEMLSWPAEWSALHGIAEIRTPIVKISAATDATAERYEVRREGDRYPVEGARGLQFPYRAPERLRVLSSSSYRRGLENPITPAPAPTPTAIATPPDPKAAWFSRYRDHFSQNGYRAPPHHIYEAFLDVVDRPGAILELGSGNGLLLRFLRDNSPHSLQCTGIDSNPEAIRVAQSIVFPERSQAFSIDDVRTCPVLGPYEIIVANPLYADSGYYDQRDGQIQRLHGDGFIRRFVQRCVDNLSKGGRLVLFCYAEQLQQIASFRETFNNELSAFSPRIHTPPSAGVTFFLIEP